MYSRWEWPHIHPEFSVFQYLLILGEDTKQNQSSFWALFLTADLQLSLISGVRLPFAMWDLNHPAAAGLLVNFITPAAPYWTSPALSFSPPHVAPRDKAFSSSHQNRQRPEKWHFHHKQRCPLQYPLDFGWGIAPCCFLSKGCLPKW